MNEIAALLRGLALCALSTGSAMAQSVEIVAIVVDENARPVADAVVVAVPAEGEVRPSSRARTDVIDQVDKEFVPKVKPVWVGTAVTFPNHDNVRHHVYSFSAAKRFELPLYVGNPAQPVVFDRPGVVVLGCNVHDWMLGFVYVSASPFFGKTDKDGRAVLSDLSPAVYTVRVWHPQLDVSEESTRQAVNAVRPGRFEVKWALKLKPEVRVRRAPIADRPSRY